MNDPYGRYGDRDSFGTVGALVTPHDTNDLAQVAKYLEVTSIAGGAVLKILPAGNADGAWVTYDPVFVGFVPKFRVRKVHTDTNCTVVAAS